jgi:hypothetical protein
LNIPTAPGLFTVFSATQEKVGIQRRRIVKYLSGIPRCSW